MNALRQALSSYRDQLLPAWCWMYAHLSRRGKTDRRFHAFGVGLSKTGTHSIAAALGDGCRAAHEVCRPPLRRCLTGVRLGQSEKTISRLLAVRDSKLNLELEVDHVLGTMIRPLYRAFPNAKYILSVRDARSWIESEISQRLEIRLPALETLRYDRGYAYTKYDERLQQLGMFPVKGYLAYWCEHNHRILGLVPPEQLFVIRTNEISERIGEIAAWLGMADFKTDPKKTRQYVRKDKVALSQYVNECYLQEEIQRHCAPLEKMLGLGE